MPSNEHDHAAAARDAHLAELHPDAERKHVRATLPGRIVLRYVERTEGEPETDLLTATYLTAVVVDGAVEFWAGADPVRRAASVPTTEIVEVDSSHEVDYTPPRINPTIQLRVSDDGGDPLDLELEAFTFDGTELRQVTDIEPELTWWRSAVGR